MEYPHILDSMLGFLIVHLLLTTTVWTDRVGLSSFSKVIYPGRDRDRDRDRDKKQAFLVPMIML